MDVRKTIGAAVIALALAASPAFAGCGENLDSDDLEDKLGGQVATNAGVDEADVEVGCPEDVEVEQGTTFDCDVTIEGNETTIEVELTDDEGTYEARLK